MIYPKFLSRGSKIAVVAPSSSYGSKEYYKVRSKTAYDNLTKKGFVVDVTKNIFNTKYFDGVESDTAQNRADEFVKAYMSDNDLILALRGGEIQLEILPYIDFNKLKEVDAKWFQGFSDNTTLTYTLTTILDMATIYGTNYGDFGMKPWHKYITQNCNFWLGKTEVIKSTNKHELPFFKYPAGEETKPYHCTENTEYKIITKQNSVEVEGRLLGGCLDLLQDLCCSKWDNTNNFLEKYKEDGFIWYLETCDLNEWDTIRALWKLKEHGWFKYVKAFMIGRPAMAKEFKIDVPECYLHVLSDLNVPIILDMDFGHVKPNFYIVNGAIGKLKVANGKGQIEYILK